MKVILAAGNMRQKQGLSDTIPQTVKQEAILLNQAELVFGEVIKGYDPYPVSIEVQPTDICNQRCNYCFHGGIGFGKDRDTSRYLSESQIKNLIANLAELRIREYSISGGGEPFLSRNISTFITEARLRNLNIRIVTNGNFIPNDLLADIVNCVEIRFSLDTVNPETYSIIRNVDPLLLSSTLVNIRSVVEEKKRQSADILIGASFITNPHNQGEIIQFADVLLGKIGVDKVIFKRDIYGRYIPDSQRDGVERSLSIVKSNWGEAVEIRTQLDKFKTGLPCVIPHFKSAINPYGDLYSCCLGAQPNEINGYHMGNLADDLNNDDINAFDVAWKNSSSIRQQMLREVKCTDCNFTDRQINGYFSQFFSINK